MSAHLENTFGAALIGMVVAAVLYGISCVQALYYYMNQKDPWYIKLTVTAVMIFDTVHQILIAHMVYTYVITDWGDPSKLGLVVWSFVAQIIFTGITAFIVQSVLTIRVWRLSGRNNYLAGIFALLVAGGFVTLLLTLAQILHFKSLAELVHIKASAIAFNTFNAVTDILIAATLCTFLNFSRTGFHRSEVVINRLILFTVNTGLLTSICALASLIAFLVAGTTFIYIAFFFCLGRLYTNTLLATYNARQVISKVDNEGGTRSGDILSFPLRDFRKEGTNQAPNLSIKIDTVTQNDQTLEENTEVSYEEECTKKVPALQ